MFNNPAEVTDKYPHQITRKLYQLHHIHPLNSPQRMILYLQVQSNALAALEAIDVDMADEVLAAGCITGDRVNGLCDGVTGDW